MPGCRCETPKRPPLIRTLGPRSGTTTLASRTVADEYFTVSQKVEALYGQPAQLPADAAGPTMAGLRREHHRLLGNGWCPPRPQLDRAFESICETCSYFRTSIEFRPVLQAQHDHAATHSQEHRQQLFASLLARVGRRPGAAASASPGLP